MGWNPFDWTAEPFLALYLSAAVLVFVSGFYLRSALGPPLRRAAPLNLLEAAYLCDGPSRLADVALLSLAMADGATITPTTHKITVTDQAPLARLIERPAVLHVQPDMTRKEFLHAVEPLAERVAGRLQTLGYCPTEAEIATFRTSVLLVVVALLAFGGIKVWVGAERHHPVGILLVFLAITAVAGFALATRPRRTRAGRDALRAYRASHARASRAPLSEELLLAVALSGPVVLSGTPYSSIYAAQQSSDGGGGDGGGGCGGGGGGCGGCS